MAGNTARSAASLFQAVRTQLAAVPARARAPLPARPGLWYWVRAALAFRPVHNPVAPTTPPQTAHDTSTPPAPAPRRHDPLTEVIQRIAEASAPQRLHHRRAISQLAAGRADSLGIALDRDLARTLTRALFHARDLARTLASTHTFDLASNLASDLARARTITRRHTRDHTPTLAHARTLALNLASDIVRTLDFASAGDLDLASALDLASDLASDLSLALDLGLTRDFDLTLLDNPTAVAEQLKRAASDFRGADLRRARLREADLAWLKWDERTKWPQEWQERIENASVEQPEGSGQYIVLPAYDNEPSDVPTDA
ncbi:hypothetical protein [Streptomyces sp. NPDC094468]|uniref:hypothetical protein n=1 Tax=Streptomyces sp. NPDC094468 TaxID=3366066 RepID=UPI00382AC79E